MAWCSGLGAEAGGWGLEAGSRGLKFISPEPGISGLEKTAPDVPGSDKGFLIPKISKDYKRGLGLDLGPRGSGQKARS